MTLKVLGKDATAPTTNAENGGDLESDSDSHGWIGQPFEITPEIGPIRNLFFKDLNGRTIVLHNVGTRNTILTIKIALHQNHYIDSDELKALRLLWAAKQLEGETSNSCPETFWLTFPDHCTLSDYGVLEVCAHIESRVCLARFELIYHRSLAYI